MNENSHKLMAYMMGWRMGARASAINAEQSQNRDFIIGHEAGRKAVQKAYSKAMRGYQAELSPLRQPTESQT